MRPGRSNGPSEESSKPGAAFCSSAVPVTAFGRRLLFLSKAQVRQLDRRACGFGHYRGTEIGFLLIERSASNKTSNRRLFEMPFLPLKPACDLLRKRAAAFWQRPFVFLGKEVRRQEKSEPKNRRLQNFEPKKWASAVPSDFGQTNCVHFYILWFCNLRFALDFFMTADSSPWRGGRPPRAQSRRLAPGTGTSPTY
jgi:hypothetical protein